MQSGLSVEEAAARLRTDPARIEALENGDFSSFSDPVAARGTLRLYARLLGMDATPLIRALREMQDLDAERKGREVQTEEPSAPEASGLRVPSRRFRIRRNMQDVAEGKDFRPKVQEEDSPVLSESVRRLPSRRTRMRMKEKEQGRSALLLSKVALQKNKWVAGTVLTAAFLLVSLCVFLFTGNEKPEAASVLPKADGKSTETVSPPAESKAVVHLVKPAESNKYGDEYDVKNADQVVVKITALKETGIRVRADGPMGKVLADTRLAPNESKTFTHDKWLSLRIEHPNYVKITVNGVTIDTSTQTSLQLYQFKLRNE
jgi:cytoskeletal protein RodZ